VRIDGSKMIGYDQIIRRIFHFSRNALSPCYSSYGIILCEVSRTLGLIVQTSWCE